MIDLNPLLVNSNSEKYVAVVISAAEKLLSFPPLSASFFSFKFFFSSLSSLLSSSKLSALSISSSSLSFDLPNPTLVSLKRAFAAVKRCELRSTSTAVMPPRGVNVAASLRQIVYDYAWEPVVRDPEIGMIPGFTDGGLEIVRSNLVVMFSPISRDLKWVSEFLDVKTGGDECLSELDLFKSKLGEIFDCVNDLFDNRDILLSWIDVKSEDSSGEMGLKSGFFESGIRELGWGHCSTDSIVFGSLIVPFGLVYPTIGICPKLSTSHKFTVQSSLEIGDINGKPIECKCGELEFSSAELFSGNRCDEFINLASAAEEPHQNSLIEFFCHGITKLSIKALRMRDDLIELERYTCDTFVVREVSQESDQDQEQESGFWADRVLEILEKETGEKVAKKSSPIWQILLSYLCREGYSALVSLTNSNGSSRTGILKPFTFSTGLICVFDNEVSPQTVDHEDSRKEVNCTEYTRKASKKILNSLHAISWEEFCRSVKDYGQIDLEDVYFSKFGKSKKFKFLKCWMKQIRQPRGCSLSVASNCDAQEDVEADPIEKTHNSSEEKEKAISLPVSEEDIALSGNRISVRHENDTSVYASESSEDFFANLPSKIKQGIESEEIDLAALAERLVKSCIFYSSQRLEKDYSCENGTLLLVTEELIKILLKEPKDLVAKFRKKESSSMACEQKSDETAPGSIIREYELQILFRMEILIRSEIGLGSEESVVHKFARQICMLLEAIQCKLDGGFFGDWSLDKYVNKIIKARYHHILGEVVSIIYTEMDLLMFSDEDQEDSFMNNEDSSQSGRENIQSNIKSHHHSRRSKDVPRTSKKSLFQKKTKECREVEAQERRERARRFSSFTSWMPDLCRVWAPKQAKNSKDKADKQKKMAKRKKEERSVEYDRVCETPMTTDNKRTRTDNKDEYECGTLPRSSVPKALFQDNS